MQKKIFREEEIIEACGIKFPVEDVVKKCSAHCRYCSEDCKSRKEQEQ
jgi:hypothetical protein